MPEMNPHPSQDQLNAYNLGRLSPDEAVAVENHVSECEPCCETIISLSSDDTFVGWLKEARQAITDQTLDHDRLDAVPDSTGAIPKPLAEHPRYEIVNLVGKGGMGRVYKARHRMMDRSVALKLINRQWIRNEEVIDRFHREVKTAASLDHPNIVTSHDAEQADDLHFLVMEFVDGVDLSETVKQRGSLPVAEACNYIRQVAEGLQYAHDRGMVHRDIKPHNLMVTLDRVVKILDFGLASLTPQATPGEPISEDADGNLTVAGAIMGTPDFISPEQARDARKVDGRSDIYSLGMTLYYLLAGRVPFGEGSAIEKLKKHAEAEPAPLSQFRDDVPAELENIIHRMTAKNLAERFQSPQEVADALQPFANELATVSKPQPSLQKTRAAGGSNFKWIGAAILFAILVTGGVFLLNLNNPETDYKSLDKFLTTVFQRKESTTTTQTSEFAREVQAARPFSYDLTLVPANAQRVVGARPRNILRDPQLAKLRESVPPLAGFTSLFVNENVAEVLAITLPKSGRMSNPRIIILTVEQGDALEEVDRAVGILTSEPDDVGSEYHRTGYVSREGRLMVRQIDRKTVVLGTRKELDEHKLAMNDPKHNELREVATGMQECEAFVMASSQDILAFGPEKASTNAGTINEILKQLRFLHEETKFVTATVALGEKPQLQLYLRAKAQERNHEVAMAVSEIRDQAMTLIREDMNLLADGTFFKDKESVAAAAASLLLSQVTEPTPQDTVLDVPLSPAMSSIVKMIGEQFDAKKIQRDRVQLSMKSISLGFFQFEAKHGYLPSASTKIPGAAHPVSWRVAILPYLGQKELYAQYKLDEPWDSEHNKTLLAKMPETYRHPGSWRQSTETNVVSFVGADSAVGSGDEPVRLGEFRDDPRLTILVAESAAGIPWTKPEDALEDVPIIAGEPLPPIGGLGEVGWHAVFADGSVRFVPRNTSTDVIAAMLTRNGGESVKVEDGKFSLRKVGERTRE
ncbi:MAG: protein kinase [Planctomycetota bacterium]